MTCRILMFLFFAVTASSCAHNSNPRCVEASVHHDVLINTAKMFLKSEGEPDYEVFQYRVFDNLRDGCYVVAAAVTPDAFDSEILILIGRDGVIRAVAPNGESFFEIRGDRAWGTRPSKAYPLVK